MKTWSRSLALAALSVGTFLTVQLGVRGGDAPSRDAIKLEPLKWQQFLDRIAENKDAKFTVVDAWSTTCVPCKANFPHLVEMDRKYSKKGVTVISLSLDDPSDRKAVDEARRFLEQKQAKFTNILLDEELGVGFEKLNINA